MVQSSEKGAHLPPVQGIDHANVRHFPSKDVISMI